MTASSIPNQGAPNQSSPSQGPSASEVSPEEAQLLLRQEKSLRRSVPTAVPGAFVALGALCATGSLSTVAMRLATRVPVTPQLDPRVLVMIPSLAWILVSLVPILVFRDRWRRGLGARWILVMAGWAVLWIAGMLVNSTMLAGLVAAGFLVLFVVTVTTEAAHLARTRAQGAGQA